MGLFIDTWGWICLINPNEPRHREVETFYRNFRQSKGLIYTTDYIIDETVTLIFKRMHFGAAQNGIHQIQRAIEAGYLHLEWINLYRFERAKELRARFDDKPEISFTDLTSMVVMKELQLNQILTEDEHFIQVGMGFLKVP